jgi:nickel/cobalt exporter
MRWLGFALLVVLSGAAIWLWGMGSARDVGAWANAGQRQVQSEMATFLRALKRGETAALLGLLGLCFAYGFFHAAGPGHGKMVIGGVGLAARTSALRLSALAVASSLAQAGTAILLVGAGALVFGWSRSQMTGFADAWLEPLSMAAVALVGLWLALRGLRGLRASFAKEAEVCSSCGHAHGPSVEQAEQVVGWRSALTVIAAVALRPCTGALFLLIITWSMGVFYAGILGALVMGLGTASVTVLVAIAAVTARGTVLAQLGTSTSAARAASGLQVAAGLGIAMLAVQLMLAAL